MRNHMRRIATARLDTHGYDAALQEDIATVELLMRQDIAKSNCKADNSDGKAGTRDSEFVAFCSEMETSLRSLVNAAAAGEASAVKLSFKAINQACMNCHARFRTRTAKS